MSFRRFTRGLALAAAVVLCASPLPAGERAPRTITVTGEGLVRAEPDMAIIRFSVRSLNKDIHEAKRENEAMTAKVREVALAHGVKVGNLQMRGLTINAETNWTGSQHVPTGDYIVIRSFKVRHEEVSRVEGFVTALLETGIRKVEEVDLDVSNRNTLEAQAVDLALDDASRQAVRMGARLGQKIGEPISIRKGSENFLSFSNGITSNYMAAETVGGMSGREEFGEIIIKSDVTVVFALETAEAPASSEALSASEEAPASPEGGE